MTLHDWLNPGTITGVVALVISGNGLLYTRRVDRRGRSQDRPIVNIDLQPADQPGWLMLWLSMENHTTGVWILEEVSFPRAKEVRVAIKGDFGSLKDDGNYQPGIPISERARKAPLALNLRADPI